MCQSVVLDGHWITGMGELRVAIAPVLPAIREGYVEPIDDLSCLCPRDLEETAKRIGRIAMNDHGGDPMMWHFVRREQ
jgi:hypothetical protein